MPAKHQRIFGASPDAGYTISTSRTLYLDTSAVRAMGRKLAVWSARQRAYTSVLTIIELLNGIILSAVEFGRRRAAIGAIFDSALEIDWQMPDVKVRCAFRLLRPKYDTSDLRVQCLYRILACLKKARHLAELVQTLPALHLRFPLEYFNHYDEVMSRSVIDSAAKWSRCIRDLYEHESTARYLAVFNLPPDTPIRDATERIRHTVFAYGTIVDAMSHAFARDEEFTSNALFKSYDGLIPAFIMALNERHWEEVTFLQTPGRNDAADLYHFAYWVPGVEIVTTDRGMTKTANRIGIKVADCSAGLLGV